MTNIDDKIRDISLDAEELLGPPKVDGVGYLLMILLALVAGVIGGCLVLVLGYFSFGKFSLQAGVSPLLLGMVTFFSLIVTNYLTLWGMINIFPHIYKGSRTLYVQVTLFTILLYILMAGVYLFVGANSFESDGVLMVYSIHCILNSFGLFILTGLLSQYRYSLLVFYSSMIALVLSGLGVYSIFSLFSTSMTAIALLTLLIAVISFVSAFFLFGVYFLYYRIYTLTGSDPIGNIFSQIVQDEDRERLQAEKTLLNQ